MSDETKVAAALATGEGGAGAQATGNPELAAELEKAKHTADVWKGHATKRADRIKELEEEVRKLKATKQVDEVAAGIPEDVRGDTPSETIKAALTGSKQMVDEAAGKTSEEIASIRKEMAENNQRMFVRQLSANHGKFFEMVGPGGVNEKLWNQFKANNRETFASVMGSQDVERFGVLVGQFCGQFGIQNPSGHQGGTAAPSPASALGGQQISAGSGADDQRTYTGEEYLKELESAEDARNGGDMQTYREVTARLTKALNEGRVKN